MTWRTIDDLSSIKPGRVTMRASEQTSVYEADDETGEGATLVALFTGEVRVTITKPCLQVLTEGEFYWYDPAVDQTARKTSDLVFTTLDRPSPLSPEMLAIQQLMRRNEIERDHTRAEMERLIYETRHQPAAPDGGTAHNRKAKKGNATRDDPERVPDDTVEPGSGSDSEISGSAGDDAGKANPSKGDEGGKSARHSADR